MTVTYTSYEIWMMPVLGESGGLSTQEVIFSCRDADERQTYVICRRPFSDETPHVACVSVIGDESDSKHTCCRIHQVGEDERKAVRGAFHAGPDAGIDVTRQDMPHTTDYDMEVI